MVVFICLIVVTFFVWVINLCITSVDKKGPNSNINPDIRSYVIVEELCSGFFRRLKELFSSTSKEGLTDAFIEGLFRKFWKTFLLIGTVLFGWFIWPTPYKQLPLGNGIVPQREHRFSKQVERWNAIEKKWK